MKKCKHYTKWFLVLLLATLVAACSSSNNGNGDGSQSTTKAITAYALADSTGTIDESAKTIAVSLPYGTDVTALVATFTSAEAVTVGLDLQSSAVTPNDFTNPVEYTVTAEDSTTAVYTVTATVALASDKAITAYSLNGVKGLVKQAAKTISVNLPKGTEVTNLIATFRTTGVSVAIGTDLQTSKLTPNDFTNPVAYTVTAGDNSTELYTVTVNVALGNGPAPVELGTAGNFVVLAKSGISTTGTTAIVGDLGISPADSTYVTGFDLIADATNVFSTSSLVTGSIFAADYAVPAPEQMTAAISDMEIAFTDAAGRTLPDYTELGTGDISGMTLTSGLYKWSTGVLITNAGVTLTGGVNDVWIFQIAENLTIDNSAIITLAGGAQAKNIFWQVSGAATLGTAADFKGIILSQTLISMNTGAIFNGRALAQTAVTLDATAITAP